MHKEELKFEHGGVTFHIRARATRGDQYEMHAAMTDNTEIHGVDVVKIKAKPLRLYPWLIERFVTGWSLSEPFSLKALLDQPADPGEDLVLLLGSYILNHTGIVVSAKEVELKNA